MRLILILCLLLGAVLPARSQYQPYAVQWLEHAATAKAGRDYLGITNFFPGANIVFTPSGPLGYTISSTGGGGSLSNVVANFFTTNLFTFPLALTNGFINAVYGNANYYPLVGNPSGFLTTAGISIALTNFDTRNWTNSHLLSIGEIYSDTAGRFHLTTDGYLYLTPHGSHPISLEADGSFNPKIDFGGTTLVMTHDFSALDRSLLYRPTGGGTQQGVDFWNDGKISIGNNFGSAANDAFYVDQGNSLIVTKSGINLVVNGTAFGNGIGITNAQFSSHIKTNSVLLGGVITNLNFIGGTNLTVAGTNVGGTANLWFNVGGPGGIPSGSNVWFLNGNTLGNTNSWLGSIDNEPLALRVNSINVGFFGINDSLALGPLAQCPGNQSCAVGKASTSAGPGSVAVGWQSSASAQSATAVGLSALASGTYSSSFGAAAIANNNAATAFGYQSVAHGDSSLAIGFQATANGDTSSAIGYGNIANGVGSTSIGLQSTSGGDLSMAMGTVAATVNQGSFVWSDSQALGISDTAQDQFIVTASGGAKFYTSGSAGGFTADWFQYYRANSVTVAALATSKAITFTTPLASANYVPTVTAGFSLGTISMYCDTLATTGFTVHFSASVVGGGTLYYTAVLNQ